ncbi:hypothetical protein BDV96DRAFT_608080 [Lophiotrema nucula]|uniref:RING-type domain-containing protein n=1 Tax=Lophiotrema nucula TaxID=690887 RepID=A0A6A5YE73_9PLEO|nr:hypothetical protein BDV96DRAFT_608080 [Lophiotrema nucula]
MSLDERSNTRTYDHVVEYECCICLNEIPESDAACCSNSPLPLKLFAHLFEKEFVDNIAYCSDCDTNICVGCKQLWKPDHRCNAQVNGVIDRSILPYTPKCRIKLCPHCGAPIEHGEGCNHITYRYCKHQFCFIYLVRWSGAHPSCPGCGDPSCCYDNHGYEKSARKLRGDTGLDPDGRNRLGVNAHGRTRHDPYEEDNHDYEDHDNEGRCDENEDDNQYNEDGDQAEEQELEETSGSTKIWYKAMLPTRMVRIITKKILRGAIVEKIKVSIASKTTQSTRTQSRMASFQHPTSHHRTIRSLLSPHNLGKKLKMYHLRKSDPS